jgi:hypothetical protein
MKTNQDLVNKILEEHEDLRDEGLLNSTLEEVDTDSIISPEWLEQKYLNQSSDLESIQKWVEKIEKGEAIPPLLLDIENNLIDGVHRILALKKLKISRILVLRYKSSLKLSPMN